MSEKIGNEEKMAALSQIGMPVQPKGDKEEQAVPEEAKEEAVEEKQEAKQDEKEEDIDLSVFDKAFGRKVESKEELNTLFEKADSFEKIKTEYEDIKQKLDEYKSLAEDKNPLDYFDSEDEYVRYEFLKRNKDKLSEEATKVLSALSPSKVKELDGVEALKIDLMVNDGMTGEEAEAYLLKRYDIDDFDSEDLELGVKATIKKDVRNAKASLGKLYEGIEIPKRVDLSAAREERKATWESPLKATLEDVKKIEIADGHEFIVTDDMKKGYYDETLKALIDTGADYSEEAVAKIRQGVEKQILIDNFDKVLKSYATDLEEQFKAKTREQYHNDKPFDSAAKPSADSGDNESKMQRLLN